MDQEILNKCNIFIEKANEKLDLANYCYKTGKYNSMVSNCYFYIYNCCRAIYNLILHKDTNSHKVLIGDFNKIFVHEKNYFDNETGKILGLLQKQRSLCDYETTYILDKNIAIKCYNYSIELGEKLINFYNNELNKLI